MELHFQNKQKPIKATKIGALLQIITKKYSFMNKKNKLLTNHTKINENACEVGISC